MARTLSTLVTSLWSVDSCIRCMLIHLFLQVSVSSLDVIRKNSLPRSQILLVRGNNVIDGGESGSVNSVNEANRVFADATVYPNPTTDYFLVSGLEANTVWTGRLVDMSGSLVRDVNGTGSTRIELAGIKRGLYFLQLTSSATASTTLRVIIQ